MSVDLSTMKELDQMHGHLCPQYGRYVGQEFPESADAKTIEQLPFLPVTAFKNFELKSISDEDVYRVMVSSGTGGKRSKVFLDRETARAQTAELSKTLIREFGGSRLPMINVQGSDGGNNQFTASSAAVNGFSIMASKLLNTSTTPDHNEIQAIQDQTMGGVSFVFGFTFNLWIFFKHLEREGVSNFLPDSLVIHGGGWKRLEDQKVSGFEFNALAKKVLGSSRVTNYYGLVEQTGTIFMDCEFGNMHEPPSGALIIRKQSDLSPVSIGEVGLIQVLSTIQKSYPGHSLLTEDLGTWSPNSYCKCGNPGKILKVIGRAKQAEIRGCSDAQLS
jgi:phenylacetate-coenzyme A ligase PaaK-like adenylate-forming protein